MPGLVARRGYPMSHDRCIYPLLSGDTADTCERDWVAMDLTQAQWAFLDELRRGACPAVAQLDASMVGPLIRARLVSWDDVVGDTAQRCNLPTTIFKLTQLGERRLAEGGTQQSPPGTP